MKRLKRHILYLISVLIVTSCSQGIEESSVESPDQDLVEFYLDFPTRSVGVDNTSSTLDPLSDYFEKNSSLLLISQRTNYVSISFEDNNSDGSKNELLYKYVWEGEGKEAQEETSGNTPNWEIGYNFKPLSTWKNPMNWSSVMARGAFGNSYAFGAIYYPVENQSRSDIETDQSILNNLKKSNLLGAYHLTKSLYERFRFRLYHLMACMKVTILVPCVDPDDQTKGYNERTILGTMLGLNKDFTIDWGARGSEEPPILKADETVTTVANIKMYLQPSEGPREEKEWDLSNFGLEGKAKVREYTFMALFPPQTLSNTDNILEFDIKREGSETVTAAKYYWSTSQLLTHLQVSAGTITNLILYFPVEENNALMIKSEILEWGQTDTIVTITPEE